MKTIPLSQGKVAIVDDEDFERLSVFKWHVLKRPNGLWHASRTFKRFGVKRTIYMHRVIIGARPGILIDHRDGDGLNNRRHNIRHATKQQNSQNQTKLRQNKTSRFRGVCWKTAFSRWDAHIQAARAKSRPPQQIYLGRFSDEVEAAKAYDRAAIKYFGEFASTNFPRSEYVSQ